MEILRHMFIGQDPHLTQGPAGSLRVKGAVLPQEDTIVDAVPSFTRILERDLTLNKDLQSLRNFNLTTFQGVASYMGSREDGPEAANPEPANPQPVGQLTFLLARLGFDVLSARRGFFTSFDLHQRSHTGETFKCNLCNKAFLQSSNLRVHQGVHTKEKPYRSAVCGKEFTQESTLQGHNLASHKGEALCV